jgi:anti-sigma factor RsiW
MNARPTSEELMMFVDGELDPARAAEIAALIDADPDARDTARGLRIAGAGDIADRVMRAIEADGAGVVDLGARRRERSIRPWVFAGPIGALAVAAAVALWVNGPNVHKYVSGAATMAMTSGAAVVAESVAAMAPSASAEVDEVDFGARAGSIFYVPSDGIGTTAVVWLTDDVGANLGDRR